MVVVRMFHTHSPTGALVLGRRLGRPSSTVWLLLVLLPSLFSRVPGRAIFLGASPDAAAGETSPRLLQSEADGGGNSTSSLREFMRAFAAVGAKDSECFSFNLK
jgi:hypothetical protein